MRLQCMVLGLLFFGIGFFFFIGKAIPMLKGCVSLVSGISGKGVCLVYDCMACFDGN